MPLSTAAPDSNLFLQLRSMVQVLLRRDNAYGEGARVISAEVNEPNVITGLFRDGRKLFEYTFEIDKKLSYQMVLQRSDSFIEGYMEVVRTDAPRTKAAKCINGTPCGKGCIEPEDICRIKPSAIGQVGELAALKRVVAKVRPSDTPRAIVGRVNKELSQPEASESPADPYNKPLRELQKIAQERGVYRSNHQNKQQLQETLRVLDQDPESQERLRRSLEKQRQARSEGQQALRSGGKLLTDPIKLWKNLERVTKLLGTDPQTAAIASTLILAGITAGIYARTRDHYKSGLQESAQMAMQRAQRVAIQDTNKPNVLFAVGGYASTGSLGERMRDELEAPLDDTKGELWLKQSNHIVPFNHGEFDIPETAVSKRNSDGSYNPFYLGHVAHHSMGKYIQNLQRGGRNEAAVDLAAQMYAYGARYPNANLNMLGHGSGGNVVNEATEILSRMRSSDGKGPNGSELIKRLNIVNLGTANFGFTDDRLWNTANHRTITSSSDPFSILPQRAAQWISTVPGHEIGDYLKNMDVRERLRESFGYYSDSVLGRRQANERWRETSKEIGTVFRAFGFNPVAQVWDGFNAAKRLAERNPTAATLSVVGTLGIGSVALYKYSNARRRAGLQDAANQAYDNVQALEKDVPTVRQGNYMFFVGGQGAPAHELEQKFVTAANRGKDKRDWLDESHHFERFDPESGTAPPPLGTPGAAVNGLSQAVGQYVVQGNNNDSIQLASRLYAYGNKVQPNGRLPIHVMAYDTGGLTARQAVETLKRMGPTVRFTAANGRSTQRKVGELIAERTQLVTLGTPGFGIEYDSDLPETNIMGDNDPISGLPFVQREDGKRSRGTGVKGHSVDEYLASEDVMNQVRNTFAKNANRRKRQKPEKPKRAKAAQTPAPTPTPAPPVGVAPTPGPTPAPAPAPAGKPKRSKAKGQPQASASPSPAPPKEPTGIRKLIGQLNLPAAPTDPQDPRNQSNWGNLSASEKRSALRAYANSRPNS